jgi:hypothetical protein
MSAGPSIEITGTGVLVAVGLMVGGFVLWRASTVASQAAGEAWDSAKTGAATVGGWVNPVSDENLAYRGVNAVGEAVTGNADWSLGSAIYDWINPEPPAPYTSGGGGVFTGTGATGTW